MTLNDMSVGFFDDRGDFRLIPLFIPDAWRIATCHELIVSQHELMLGIEHFCNHLQYCIDIIIFIVINTTASPYLRLQCYVKPGNSEGYNLSISISRFLDSR